MKKKIKIKLEHGTVVCSYYEVPKDNAPIVIITNGSNGFYNYGMFPSIQEEFLKNDISSIAYNFSHGGVEDGNDYFTQLDLYEKNSMSLEVMDLCGIVRNLSGSFNIKSSQKLFLMAHSLGGIPTIFAAKELFQEGISIDGIVLLASVSTLNLYSQETMDNWEKNGVWLMKNNRTNQMLPRGMDFYKEVKRANEEWNVQNALNSIKTRFLILHGEKDESVNISNSVSLDKWVTEKGLKSTFEIIPNGTHTMNTKHPFEGNTPELENMINIAVKWIKT